MILCSILLLTVLFAKLCSVLCEETSLLPNDEGMQTNYNTRSLLRRTVRLPMRRDTRTSSSEAMEFTASSQKGSVIIEKGSTVTFSCTFNSTTPHILQLFESSSLIYTSDVANVLTYTKTKVDCSVTQYTCRERVSDSVTPLIFHGDSIVVYVNCPLQLRSWFSKNNTVYGPGAPSTGWPLLEYIIAGHPPPQKFSLLRRTSVTPSWESVEGFKVSFEAYPNTNPPVYAVRLDTSTWSHPRDTDYKLTVDNGVEPDKLYIFFTFLQDDGLTSKTKATPPPEIKWRLSSTARTSITTGGETMSSTWYLGPVIGYGTSFVVIVIIGVTCYRRRAARIAERRRRRHDLPNRCTGGTLAFHGVRRCPAAPSVTTANCSAGGIDNLGADLIFATSTSGSLQYGPPPSYDVAISVTVVTMADAMPGQNNMTHVDVLPSYDAACKTDGSPPAYSQDLDQGR